jgi:hypothetical protein
MLGTEKVSATSYPPVVLWRPEERWSRDRRRRRHLRRDEQHRQHRPCRRHLLESNPAGRGEKERLANLRKTAGGNRCELSRTEILQKILPLAQQGSEIGDLRCRARSGSSARGVAAAAIWIRIATCGGAGATEGNYHAYCREADVWARITEAVVLCVRVRVVNCDTWASPDTTPNLATS